MTMFLHTDRVPATRPAPAAAGARGVGGGIGFGELLRVALEALAANKMRAFLTMLGIIIGVAAVTTMIAIAQGAARAAQQSIQRLGTNVLSVSPASQRSGGISYGLGSSQSLTPDDAAAIGKLPDVARIAPEYSGRGQVVHGDQNTATNILGTTPAYAPIRNLHVDAGRFFTHADVDRRARIAVLGATVSTSLFGDSDPVGQTLKINGQSFQVAGVLRAVGGNGRSPDDQVYVPLSTAQRRLYGVRHLTGTSVQASSQDVMAGLQAQIEALIHQRHKLPADQPADVRIFNQADLAEAAGEQSRVLTLLLGGVALVSLLVGGIGIMNIMLVSVTERTREIGLRKAIGAKARDIMAQFLIEAVTMSLLGVLLGALTGVGGAVLVAHLARWPTVLSPAAIALAFGFAAAVGIFFGIYPAGRAAPLNPIQALRYE